MPRSIRRRSSSLSTVLFLVGVLAGGFLLFQGIASSYDTRADGSSDPPAADEPKPDIVVSYTINNVGYIEPCG